MKTAVAKGQLLLQNTIVSFTRIAQGDFISLTDIAKVKIPDEPKDVVKNWLRSRSIIDFLGLWEQINNPSFKGVEFDSFKNQAGANSFTLSPSSRLNALGWQAKVSLAEGLIKAYQDFLHHQSPVGRTSVRQAD